MTIMASKFLSTPSARRATRRPQRIPRRGDISIHALREEGDLLTVPPTSIKEVFLSTPSARRATLGGKEMSTNVYDFYPRPPRGGRPGAVQ